MNDAQVAVIGLGAVGSMTLMELARRGVPVIGFDQGTAPNDRSGHAGESRLLLTLTSIDGGAEDPLLAPAAEAWTAFERSTGRTVLTRQGGLMIGREGSPYIEGLSIAARKRHGDDRALLTRAAVQARFPQFRLSEDEVAVYDDLGSGIRSEWAVAGAVAAARRAGADVHTDERVLGWSVEGSYVRVYTAQRDYRVERIVVASGAYIGDLLPDLPVRARRLVKAWFAPEDDHVQTFSARDFPVFSMNAPQELGAFVYGAPSFDQPYVKIGADFDWGYAEPPSSMDFAVGPTDLVGIRMKARTYFTGLSDSVVRSIKLMDGWTPDEEPLMGHVADSERVLVAVGFSGHGFATAPVAGAAMARLAMGERPDVDLSRYRPDRFPVRT
jgi:sarcosine oxidase